MQSSSSKLTKRNCLTNENETFLSHHYKVTRLIFYQVFDSGSHHHQMNVATSFSGKIVIDRKGGKGQKHEFMIQTFINTIWTVSKRDKKGRKRGIHKHPCHLLMSRYHIKLSKLPKIRTWSYDGKILILLSDFFIINILPNVSLIYNKLYNSTTNNIWIFKNNFLFKWEIFMQIFQFWV